MDAAARDPVWVMPLAEAADASERLVGAKARTLGRLARAGLRVPPGCCLTTQAYGHFVAEAGLDEVVRMELARKSLDEMRWEELWDAALRLRRAFLAAPVPEPIVAAVRVMRGTLGDGHASLAIRSSAPGEDGARLSFAGIHESVTGVTEMDGLLRAIRIVWASLWSDAAMLYRREMRLDPATSGMAVLVQRMVDATPSGVAFARDPRDPASGHAVVEAVPGPCADLVDGHVDPDRWMLDATTGMVLEWRPGVRAGEERPAPLLGAADLASLHERLRAIEAVVGWAPDVEWTGRGATTTILQARPITGVGTDPDDERRWYLTLRPNPARLAELRRRVVDELIPALAADGDRLAAEDVDALDDASLADALEARTMLVARWRSVYRESFIPFAHGVRRLATYYNDAVGPDDPYEFVGLLTGERFLASQRNEALAGLADRLRRDPALAATVRDAIAEAARGPANASALDVLRMRPESATFAADFEALAARFLDTTFDGQRLRDRPDLFLPTLLGMSAAPVGDRPRGDAAGRRRTLERRLLEAVGSRRHAEAREVIATARLSWRLRDDDNLLLGRIESQTLRALDVAAERLRGLRRLSGSAVREEHAELLAAALRDDQRTVELRDPEPAPRTEAAEVAVVVRQLVGQPAAAGLATGTARRVRGAADLARVRPGDVLVCEAIQPSMTHVLPLLGGVVEGRGGMLIHGAIVARELGIPCVNGVREAYDRIADGEVVTVDGHLGIVTVGPAEFDRELAHAPARE